MRKIAFVIMVAVAGSLSAATPSARKTALVNELIALTHGDSGADAVLAALAQQPNLKLPLFEVLSDRLTEAQLQELVTFFKSGTGRAYCDALAIARQRQAAKLDAMLSGSIEQSKEKRTMADMRTIATASEAYATDTNKYPAAKTMDELRPLLSPVYVRNMPSIDAWGTPFAYLVSPDQQKYRFVSAGPDKKFDPSSLKLGTKPAKSDDLVFEDGEFVQSPIPQQ